MIGDVEIKTKHSGLKKILSRGFVRKRCPVCDNRLTKQTQTHDPALRSFDGVRQSHSYDLWVCSTHGYVYVDDPVNGLSVSDYVERELIKKGMEVMKSITRLEI